ncbi:MAG: aminopeptidase [Clostridia bacterium]|nr:aminopeptidase [Clostridia bacterium]
MERRIAWNTYNDEQQKALELLCENYRRYLDKGKTERECTDNTIIIARENGYVDFTDFSAENRRLQAGDKVYFNCMGKAVMLFHIGNKPLSSGMNIVGAHIDSPRMDLKQNPLYEDGGFAYLDTHYYGGIKKYQWVTIPLSLHGVVVKKDGSAVNIVIGEDMSDPVVGISDLLIHLSADQMGKKASVVIEGEDLNLLVGSKPLSSEEKEPVKAAIMGILAEKYGIEEEDFLSAEIEVVPAGNTREFGLDRSMILGYGHDDRVCAFAALDAILKLDKTPEYTCCCMLVDKEEIGSAGATGMKSRFFENAVAELVNAAGDYSDLLVRRSLANSRMLSCDVSAGFDPIYAGAFERKNTAFLGKGVCFNKYTGSRGKGGSNDANAEFIGKIRKIMDDADISFQTAELGKVDQGGGGTIAYICAEYGMEVIDSGVAVLSMHAPWEIISKADLFEAARAYHAFMINA